MSLLNRLRRAAQTPDTLPPKTKTKAGWAKTWGVGLATADRLITAGLKAKLMTKSFAKVVTGKSRMCKRVPVYTDVSSNKKRTA